MTVSAEILSETYSGNGSTDEFEYRFKIFDKSELAVRLIEEATGETELLTVDVDYTVDGVGDDGGGAITMTTAPADGYTLDIRPEYEVKQPTSIRNQGRFLPEIHETAFDRRTLSEQMLLRLIRRAFRLPDQYEPEATPDWDTLLSIENRKGKYAFFFDETTGAPELVTGIGSQVISQSIIAALLYPQTAAEISAGVTPNNYAYEPGDDRRYTNFADFCSVVSQGVEGHIYSDHSISAAHDITGDARIIVHGRRTITLAAVANYMLKFSGRLTIEATDELLFDADGKATHTCLHATNYIPNLKNVRFLDSNAGCLGGDSNDGSTYDDILGDGVWENLVAENCANVGYALRGHETAASRSASILLKNCRTKGTTGSGNLWSSGSGYMTHFSGMKRVRFEGGDFTGHSGALNTNALECSSAEIFGGVYHDVTRGATLGENTQNFSIIGVIAKSVSSIGISVDTTNGVGQTVGVGVVADCVMNACGRALRTTCSHIKVTGNHAYECTDETGIFVFAGTSDSFIYVDDNHVYSTDSSSAFVAFLATETVTVRYGRNYTNSTLRNSFRENSGCVSIRTPSRTVTANTDVLATDHEGVIYVDAGSGGVDVDLPDEATMKSTGFTFVLIPINTTNQITITFQGGAVDGETVNGGSSLAIAAGSPTLREYRFRCVDGATGTWYALGLPPASPAYTATNVASDRTYDANATTADELADVLGNLLRDLGLR